ncbi:MAG: hypothetical protein ACQEST_04280 [Bacteroidota bacterium]
MSDEQSINFTREAFLHPINLVVLLVATISAFAMSGVGQFANLILTMTFGVELMYLGIVPRLPRFRKNVKLKKIRERSSENKQKNTFQALDKKSQKRFLVLKHLAKLIKENFDKLPYSSQGLLDNIRKKIEELLSNYLTLLDLHKRYRLYMDTSVEDSLKSEVEKEEAEMQSVKSDRLKRTLARRIMILKKRIKKFEVAKEKYLICETHLETIEDAIRYIYEQSMTMSNPEEIGFKLDNLLEEVEETSQLIEDLDKDILPFGSDLDDIDLESDFLEIEDELKSEAESNDRVDASSRIKE